MTSVQISLYEVPDTDDPAFVTGAFFAEVDGEAEVDEPEPSSCKVEDLLRWARRNAETVVVYSGSRAYNAGNVPAPGVAQRWPEGVSLRRRYWYEPPGPAQAEYWVRLIPENPSRVELLRERMSNTLGVGKVARPHEGWVDCLIGAVAGEPMTTTAGELIDFGPGPGVVIRRGVNDDQVIGNVEVRVLGPGPDQLASHI